MALSEAAAAPPVRPRLALRQGTRADHDRVDAIFARFALGSAAGYRRFLTAHAAAFLPVEAALDRAGIAALVPDWPARRRGPRLRADLAALGMPVPGRQADIAFSGEAEVLGGLYVMEGSRLGGAMLARQVRDGLPRAFLATPGGPAAWRDLIEILDRALSADQKLQSAMAAARRVFALFAAAGIAELESAR